jgi:glutathione S-transferase
MKLYHFPSPNPQKVHFALLELGLQCEIVPVDLTKENTASRNSLHSTHLGAFLCSQIAI